MNVTSLLSVTCCQRDELKAEAASLRKPSTYDTPPLKMQYAVKTETQTQRHICVLGGSKFRRTFKVLCSLCSETHLIAEQQLPSGCNLQRLLRGRLEEHWYWNWQCTSSSDAHDPTLVPVVGKRDLLSNTTVLVHRPVRKKHSNVAAPSIEQLRSLVWRGNGSFQHAQTVCDDISFPGKRRSVLSAIQPPGKVSSKPVVLSDCVCVWVSASDASDDIECSQHRILTAMVDSGVTCISHGVFFDLIQFAAQPHSPLESICPASSTFAQRVARYVAQSCDRLHDDAHQVHSRKCLRMELAPVVLSLPKRAGSRNEVIQVMVGSPSSKEESGHNKRSDERSANLTFARVRKVHRKAGLASPATHVHSKASNSDLTDNEVDGAVKVPTKRRLLLELLEADEISDQRSTKSPCKVMRHDSEATSDSCDADSRGSEGCDRLTPGQGGVCQVLTPSSSLSSSSSSSEVTDDAESVPGVPKPTATSPAPKVWSCPRCTFDNEVLDEAAFSESCTCSICGFEGVNYLLTANSSLSCAATVSESSSVGGNPHSGTSCDIVDNYKKSNNTTKNAASAASTGSAQPMAPPTSKTTFITSRRRRSRRGVNSKIVGPRQRLLLKDLVDGFQLLGIPELGRRLTLAKLSKAGDKEAMAKRLVLHMLASEQLSLDEFEECSRFGHFHSVLKVVDLPSMFANAAQEAQERKYDCIADARDAASAEEAERTRWPTVLREYNVDDPANKGCHASTTTNPVDGVWSAAWRGRGRGRKLDEGGRKQVYKVYNCAHKRWEAALVMRQSRHVRRSSKLRIRKGASGDADVVTRTSPGRPRKTSPLKIKAARSCSLDSPDVTTQISIRKRSPTKPAPNRSPQPKHVSAVESSVLDLEYDREIFALSQCSGLTGPTDSSGSHDSPATKIVLSSAAQSEGEHPMKFPHFLQVYSVAQDVVRPANTLWPNEDELGCTQMTVDENSDEDDSEEDISDSESDDELVHENFAAAVMNQMNRHQTARRKKGLNSKRAETLILAEFCSGGNLETKVEEDSEMGPNSTDDLSPWDHFDRFQSVLFQMVFTVFVARWRLRMRHNDIKLSNFLLAPAAFREQQGRRRVGEPRSSPREPFVVSYSLGNNIEFRVPLSFPHLKSCASTDGSSGGRFDSTSDVSDSESDVDDESRPHARSHRSLHCIECIKLADFGNCDIGDASLGRPIDSWHFSTLYLIPVEHIVLGTRSRQDFAGDTWMIGMSILHLIGGPEWWDELRSSVRCPVPLRDAILQAAHNDEVHFEKSLFSPDWNGGGLLDSLYFYIVLRGWKNVEQEAPASWLSVYPGSVWSAIVQFCNSDQGASVVAKDESLFGLPHGSAPGFSRLHRHVNPSSNDDPVGGSFTSTERGYCLDLIQQFLCFDPKKRPPLFEVLSTHPVFASIRHERSKGGGDQCDATVDFARGDVSTMSSY